MDDEFSFEDEFDAAVEHLKLKRKMGEVLRSFSEKLKALESAVTALRRAHDGLQTDLKIADKASGTTVNLKETHISDANIKNVADEVNEGE